MNTKLLHCFSIVFVFGLSVCFGQNQYWNTTTSEASKIGSSTYQLSDEKLSYFEFTPQLFKQDISNAPLRGTSRSFAPSITIPTLDGFKEFSIFENQIMAPELAERFPNIKSYIGFNDSGDQLFMSVSPEGIQTMINYLDKQPEFMMPITHGSNTYMLYNRDARENVNYDFVCNTIDELNDNTSKGLYSRDANDQTLRTYRLAVSVNGEYTTYHGGTVAGALAGINATMTRVNAVFETDMAINFQLIGNTDDVIYTDAATDPYSGNWSPELQSTLTAVIGEANYDIGHFFGSTGGGGFAGCIGCVCQNGVKGSAFTSPADGIPEGDSFDIDYVAHEIGHQMGANHTWSMGSEGTGVNVEPGSGTTIMGYAGITGADNVQQHSDPYFHYVSISQILNNVNTAPNNCAVTTDINNEAPIANAGSNYVIPNGTAFILKGAATDADSSDMLTYTWEQLDNGVTTSANFGPTKTTGAVWRSRPPSTSTDRYMPILERVLDGQLTETNPGITADNSSWETVSTTARNLNFGLIVRDRMVENGLGQSGQSDFDTMQVSISGNSGPFAVTSQASPEILWSNGEIKTITWDVAGTTENGVNTANVNILLSTNGGQKF